MATLDEEASQCRRCGDVALIYRQGFCLTCVDAVLDGLAGRRVKPRTVAETNEYLLQRWGIAVPNHLHVQSIASNRSPDAQRGRIEVAFTYDMTENDGDGS